MLIKFILSFVFLFFFTNVQSQNIDTLIFGIEYSIIKDTTSISESYLFTVKNNTKENFKTTLFGINNNKILVHKTAGQKIGYDFIHCGNYERITIEPDSSRSWKSEIIKSIPDMYSQIIRPKTIETLDSIYFIYWRINKNIVGPVNYYIEKDLVTNLNDPDNFIRTRSAERLRSLFDKNLTVTKVGHSKENSLAFWMKIFSNVKQGMSHSELKEVVDLNIEREYGLGRFPDIRLQLDNSFLLLIEFDELRRIKNNEIIYYPKGPSYFRDEIKNGESNSYFINGQIASKIIYSVNKLIEEKTYYYRNGEISSKTIYDDGKRTTEFKYNKDGRIHSKTIHFSSRKRKFILYDKEGNVKSQKLIERKKRKYK